MFTRPGALYAMLHPFWFSISQSFNFHSAQLHPTLQCTLYSYSMLHSVLLQQITKTKSNSHNSCNISNSFWSTAKLFLHDETNPIKTILRKSWIMHDPKCEFIHPSFHDHCIILSIQTDSFLGISCFKEQSSASHWTNMSQGEFVIRWSDGTTSGVRLLHSKLGRHNLKWKRLHTV